MVSVQYVSLDHFLWIIGGFAHRIARLVLRPDQTAIYKMPMSMRVFVLRITRSPPSP